MLRKLFIFIGCLFLLTVSYGPLAADSSLFDVEFRDADIKSVVRLLAKMNNQNVVIPTVMEGKVTASFEDIALTDAMKAILKTNGYGFMEDNGIIQIATNEQLEKLGEDLTTTAIDLKYAKASDVLPSIQGLVSSRGSAFADEMTNSVHLRDTPASVRDMRQLIASLDRKGKQVLIEAKMIEASREFINSLGIQWGVTKSGGKIQTAGLNAVGTDDNGRSLMLNAPAEGLRSAPPIAGIGMILGSFKGVITDIELSAAEQTGDINILARPSIATLNNQSANIRSGTKFYVKTTGDFNIGGTSTTESNLQEIDTGIELKVTPQISADGNIRMDIEATQSEADFTQAIDGVPAVVDKTANTTIRLRDGETTIIGGLFHLRDAKTVKGVPGLMKVPIFGNLFKSNTKGTSRRELLIFLTPKIIDSAVYELPHFVEPDSIYNPAPPVKAEKSSGAKNRKWRD